jgi:cysteine desulfurase
MSQIYLDNAATTPILPEVVQLMTESMSSTYGNPSSSHQMGRKAKARVEEARKNIARHFNASASEIFFTSGGSEADNLILFNAVLNLGVTRIISSVIEHHAVLHTITELEQTHGVSVAWVNLDPYGHVDLTHLETLLQDESEKTLVSLMHVNNEIGTILDLKKVSSLCQTHNALFHTDAVQGVGHFKIDVQDTLVDFFVASAHKFHGPKGVGFAYVRMGYPLQPLLHGGAQERGARAGTENVHSILGMEKALAVAYANLKFESTDIQSVKTHLINGLRSNFSQIAFNGRSDDPETSSYIILSVRFPKASPLLLFNLDLNGVAASGGSACQSGSNAGSHVLNGILNAEEAAMTSIRFSFSKFNTLEEVDKLITILQKLLE